MGNLGWAVVTGASSGLGREFSFALAERGHDVLAVARRGDRLQALAGEARGGTIEPLVADLSTGAGIDAVLERAAGVELALLVNNAGLATYGAFASLSPDVNVTSFVSTSKLSSR
jgi:short-subunit dehydrogenase